MVVSGGVDPAEARTAREYVALLRELKEHSGLTYRQLEQRAAERDEVLARSTLADVLRRDALPRAEVVAALVRACGAERDVPAWLAARERLAAGDAGTDQEPPGTSPEAAGAGRGRTALTATVASLGTVALLVVGAVVLLPQDEGKPTGGTTHGEASTTPSVTPGPAVGFSRVRPAHAPGFCLTDGTVRADGSGESKLVAVQRPCAEAVPPRVHLHREADGLYQIRFHHPKFDSPGCLTVLDDGAFKGTLEPWDDCRAGGESQWFRAERADGGDRWRLHSAQDDGLCVGIRGRAEESGAAAVVQRCTERDGDDQVFLIERD